MSDLWEELQAVEWEAYKKSPRGVFSIDGLRGAKIVGDAINFLISGGKCLDIGCGVLPRPYYMKVAKSVTFTGIDPFAGDREREFDFIQGVAEKLPFEDGIFDAVLFATSLDHCRCPQTAIKEAHRVLKSDGYAFFWGGIKKDNKKYREWLKKPRPARYDKHHMWAFTEGVLIDMFDSFDMVQKTKVYKGVSGESVIIFKKK